MQIIYQLFYAFIPHLKEVGIPACCRNTFLRVLKKPPTAVRGIHFLIDMSKNSLTHHCVIGRDNKGQRAAKIIMRTAHLCADGHTIRQIQYCCARRKKFKL